MLTVGDRGLTSDNAKGVLSVEIVDARTAYIVFIDSSMNFIHSSQNIPGFCL